MKKMLLMFYIGLITLVSASGLSQEGTPDKLGAGALLERGGLPFVLGELRLGNFGVAAETTGFGMTFAEGNLSVLLIGFTASSSSLWGLSDNPLRRGRTKMLLTAKATVSVEPLGKMTVFGTSKGFAAIGGLELAFGGFPVAFFDTRYLYLGNLKITSPFPLPP